MKNLILVCMSLFIGGSALLAQDAFQVTTSSSNTSRHILTLDNALANGKPNAAVFVSHVFTSRNYLADPVGVWYSGGKWKVYKQNRSALPMNMKFNVMVKDIADPNVFALRTSSGNTSGHITTIDHHTVNGNPNAKIFVSQKYGAYNDNPIGVYYAGGRWKIFNQNREAIPMNTFFNVLVNPAGAFEHTSNTSSHVSPLPTTSASDRNALLFTTQLWTSVYNPRTTGLWYSAGRWTVYNEDRQRMPNNAKFNVLAVNGGIVVLPPRPLPVPTAPAPSDPQSRFKVTFESLETGRECDSGSVMELYGTIDIYVQNISTNTRVAPYADNVPGSLVFNVRESRAIDVDGFSNRPFNLFQDFSVPTAELSNMRVFIDGHLIEDDDFSDDDLGSRSLIIPLANVTETVTVGSQTDNDNEAVGANHSEGPLYKDDAQCPSEVWIRVRIEPIR